MNRIQRLFQDRKRDLLSVFYTAGFPDLDDTVRVGEALAHAGADLIEIGIPFSDPIADGPVIQASNKTALDNGMTLGLLLDQVKELRKDVTVPIVLMGYINPVLQYGMERFCHDASNAGVDGLILPDMPLEVYESRFKNVVEAAGLIYVFLISPTTSEARIRRIDEVSNGFIYAVSASSTTGARTGFADEQIGYFKRLQAMNLRNPFLIGFGISDRETFATACDYGAGAIVGSAFISMLARKGDVSGSVTEFVRSLKG